MKRDGRGEFPAATGNVEDQGSTQFEVRSVAQEDAGVEE